LFDFCRNAVTVSANGCPAGVPVKITRTTLKSLQPVSKATWVFDSTLPGFGLKQQPSGKASYIVSFRIRGSRTKRTVTLGPITTLSPEQARERARLIIAAAREGRDLNGEGRERAQKLDAERRALANRTTVSSAAEAFLAEMERLDSPQTGAGQQQRAAWLQRSQGCDGSSSVIATARLPISTARMSKLS
jgi:Arm DNA-binding domain